MGADQEHGRESDFGADEKPPCIFPGTSKPRCSRGYSSCFFHHSRWIKPGDSKCGNKPEQDTRNQRERECEKKNSKIYSEIIHAGNAGSSEKLNRFQCASRKKRTEGAPDQSEQNAFREKLARYIRAAGAESCANGYLFAANGRAR